jgi:hypothetical protein
VLPSVDKGEPGERGPLHWFFRFELPDGDLYALDLCTAEFASTSGGRPLARVVPLHKHLQRLPLSEKLPNGWQGMIKTLGTQCKILKDKQPDLAPEEVMAGGVRHDDMCGVSHQFALLKLEDALQY